MAEETKQEKLSGGDRKEEGTPLRSKKLFWVVGIVAGVLIIVMAVIYFAAPAWQAAGPAASENGSELETAPGGAETEDSEEDAESGEMLPQTTRTAQENDDKMKSRDPFADPAVLVGLITGGEGDDLAIIETSRATYVVSEGDIVDDYWTLEEIGEKNIILKAQDKVFNLEFDAGEDPAILEEPNGEEMER